MKDRRAIPSQTKFALPHVILVSEEPSNDVVGLQDYLATIGYLVQIVEIQSIFMISTFLPLSTSTIIFCPDVAGKVNFSKLPPFRQRISLSEGHPSVTSRLYAAALKSDLYQTQNMWAIASSIDDYHQPRSEKVIWIVDDSAVDALRAQRIVESEGYTSEIFSSAIAALSSLDARSPDLMLVDKNMPNISGDMFTHAVRQFRKLQGCPIVFLSGADGDDERRDAIECGADDYLLKPANKDALSAVLKSRLLRSAKAQRLLNQDPLTRLMNREAFLESLSAAFKNNTDSTALIIIDIDRFKTVNDTHGHVAGDRVIQSLSTYLRANRRSTDVIGRFGGEEFTILLGDVSKKDAIAITERTRSGFADLDIRIADDRFLNCTFSAGLVMLSETNENQCLNVVDECLYKAKDNGRNCLVSYDDVQAVI